MDKKKLTWDDLTDEEKGFLQCFRRAEAAGGETLLQFVCMFAGICSAYGTKQHQEYAQRKATEIRTQYTRGALKRTIKYFRVRQKADNNTLNFKTYEEIISYIRYTVLKMKATA